MMFLAIKEKKKGPYSALWVTDMLGKSIGVWNGVGIVNFTQVGNCL